MGDMGGVSRGRDEKEGNCGRDGCGGVGNVCGRGDGGKGSSQEKVSSVGESVVRSNGRGESLMREKERQWMLCKEDPIGSSGRG